MAKASAYIIGPVTGFPEDNKPAFDAARAALEETGAYEKVGIPHDYVPAGAEWHEAMRISIAAMLEHASVVFLPGSEDSRGASVEGLLATELDMPCISLEEACRIIAAGEEDQ